MHRGQKANRRSIHGIRFQAQKLIFIFLLLLDIGKSISSNARSGYFVGLGGKTGLPDGAGTNIASTTCAHKCLASETCRNVIDGAGPGDCIFLDEPPPVGVSYLTRTGPYMNCLDAKRQGVNDNSVVSILPVNSLSLINVYCDMKTNGGGWVVIQRRLNGKVSFDRNWNDYQKGFGNLNEDFWLGLENLHLLTSAEAVEFRVELISQHNQTGYAEYSTFKVSNGLDFYRLTVGGYNGTVGDAFSDPGKPDRVPNGQRFSTFDKNNGPSGDNCAVGKKGGWWFNRCYLCHPNGLFGEAHGNDRHMSWIPWNANVGDLSFIEMKIRPLQKL